MNRSVLITGGAKRLGRAIALGVGRAGMNVVLHYNQSGDEAQEVARQLSDLGVHCWTVQGDLTDPAVPEAVMEAAFGVCGGTLFGLVNSASIFPAGGVMDFSFASLMENMRVNAFAPLQLARAYAARSEGGRIVNLTDSRVVDSDSAHVAYHLSKKSLDELTGMLAVELAPGFMVNAVAPGFVLPPSGADEALLEARRQENPLKAKGDPQEVVEAVLFLLTRQFVTGQTIFVDGGRHLNGRFYG